MTARLFWCIVAAAVLLGVAFRIEHIERRMLWADETWTALRVSGSTYHEFREIFDGKVHPLSDILRFQEVNASHPVTATISGLAAEEPQHTPLFYALDRLWAALAGSSVPALRFPAFLFGLAAIAAIAWLCFELTQSRLVAGTAAALAALSPFLVNYSGQAREYSLWSAMIAVTSALLLRALRRPARAGWVWYGAATVIALYSDLLMLAVLAAHALYVGVLYRKDRRVLLSFGLAAGSALLLFAPWIAVVSHGRGTILGEESWTRIAYPLRQFAQKWAFNTTAVLFDAEYANMRLLPIATALLLLLGYAAYRLFREQTRRAAWFVAAPALTIALPQIAYDLATHGHESTESRYLLPLWIALLIAVALFLGRRLREADGRGLSIAWLGCLVAVLAASGVSDAINSAATVWWDNDDNYPSTSIAAQIDATQAPALVVSEGHWAEVLVISHYVAPGTKFLLFKRAPPFPLRLGRNAFLLAPSAATLAAFRAHPGYSVVSVPVAPLLSNALLGFRRSMLRQSTGAADAASFGGFLFRLSRRATRSFEARARTSATPRAHRGDRFA